MAEDLKTPVTTGAVITVDELTFMVPVRSFWVEGTLLKGGYVSLATEFALRLLRDAGELPPGEVGAFFGFSERETQALVQELLLEGYIEPSFDRVGLSKRGEDVFDPVTGDLKLVSIEPFGDKVLLDLLSFAPVESVGSERMPWLTEIEIVDKARAAAATNAGREGFRANFGEWRDRRYKGSMGSTIRLQTIDEVVPLSRSFSPLTVPMRYVPSVSDAIEPDFSGLQERGRRGSREVLVNAVSNVVRRIVCPGDHAAAAEVTARWDGGRLKIPASSAAGVIGWLQQAHRGGAALDNPEQIRQLAGSLSSQPTATWLLEFIDAATEADGAPPVFWMPAEHAAWGRSSALADIVRDLKVGMAPGPGVVLLPRGEADERTRRDISRSYGPGKDGRNAPLFDTCVAVTPGALPLSLELLVQPGRWAVALVHVPAPNTGFPVPIGYATASPVVVASICDLLREVLAKVIESSVFWAPPGMDPITILEAIDRQLVSG